MFLPDHFLYRDVVRTVVDFWGQVWSRKHKRQIMDYKTNVDTFKTKTKNLCGRCNQNYHTSKYSWVIWLVLFLGKWSCNKVSYLTCLFSVSAPMCPCRHDTILLCVLWDTTRTNSMRRSICAQDTRANDTSHPEQWHLSFYIADWMTNSNCWSRICFIRKNNATRCIWVN